MENAVGIWVCSRHGKLWTTERKKWSVGNDPQKIGLVLSDVKIMFLPEKSLF